LQANERCVAERCTKEVLNKRRARIPSIKQAQATQNTKQKQKQPGTRKQSEQKQERKQCKLNNTEAGKPKTAGSGKSVSNQ
jgi:hypothetical protein